VNLRVFAAAIAGAGLIAGLVMFLAGRRAEVEPDRPAADDSVAAPSGGPSEPEVPAAPSAAPRAASRSRVPAPVEAPAPEESAPELGVLRIDADVPGAQVFIDRQFIGTTPLTADGVKPGTHQLNVTAEGFDGIAQTIDVEPGPRDLSVRFREVRLDAVLAVVHRHRMGSCRGQLVATADGIRYETADRDDAFSVPLADLETFQVDYQEKNLRIRLRKGRQLNFTDPDGNADRLFVFHRDVERARERLSR
jgi:hypothetical protein